MSKKHRGIYEDRGWYWIQFYDFEGKRRREKAGNTVTAAKNLLSVRKAEKLAGKLPPPRKRPVLFSELQAVH